MSPAPPLTQIIGRTERTLRALMDLVLADTGGNFHQWAALNFTAVNDGRIDRADLIALLTNALQIDDAAAEATVAELAAEGLVETVSGRVVALSEAGRERYALIRPVINQTTAPLYADLPTDDLAAARRVLTTISERTDSLLARA